MTCILTQHRQCAYSKIFHTTWHGESAEFFNPARRDELFKELKQRLILLKYPKKLIKDVIIKSNITRGEDKKVRLRS